MWLLDTQTLKPRYFINPEAVEEGYLILSHLWDAKEQTFQDLQLIHHRCSSTGEDPRALVSSKIRGCCEVAARHGYKWAWIDTCCIDKTSSAELSEAINSMFRYYTLSLVCYVYLRDMPETDPSELFGEVGDPKAANNPHFANHRWHKRGWTLQELIAPRVVHFLSHNWEYLGSKADLADGLEVITRIPASILRLEENPSDMSVAQRMSWAAQRETTRVEDEAYCLLGIFDVNMPTLYGEGRKAFQRLQEEIMRRTPDTTLFAWGPRCAYDELCEYTHDSMSGLFATCPTDFIESSAIKFSPIPIGPIETPEEPERPTDPDDDVSVPVLSTRVRDSDCMIRYQDFWDIDQTGDVMTFNITPHGVFVRFPVIEYNGQTFGDLSWYQGDTRILLILRRRTSEASDTLPLYDIGLHGEKPDPAIDAPCVRLIKVPYIREGEPPPESEQILPPAVWKDLYLAQDSEELVEEPLYIPTNHDFPPFIRFPEHIFAPFLESFRAENVYVPNVILPWTGAPAATVSFLIQHRQYGPLSVLVQFGRCNLGTVTRLRPINYYIKPHLGPVWVNIRARAGEEPVPIDRCHDCPADHLPIWPDLQRRFTVETPAPAGDAGAGGGGGRAHTHRRRRRIVRWAFWLSFTRSPLAEMYTLQTVTLDIRYLTREDMRRREAEQAQHHHHRPSFLQRALDALVPSYVRGVLASVTSGTIMSGEALLALGMQFVARCDPRAVLYLDDGSESTHLKPLTKGSPSPDELDAWVTPLTHALGTEELLLSILDRRRDLL